MQLAPLRVTKIGASLNAGIAQMLSRSIVAAQLIGRPFGKCKKGQVQP
jgi:hypothetical protein